MSTPRRVGSFCNLRRRGERGAELVEMAFALPILLTLLLGIIWFARAYNIYETMTRAARAGARVAVRSTRSSGTGGGELESLAAVSFTVEPSVGASAFDSIQVACWNFSRASNCADPAVWLPRH